MKVENQTTKKPATDNTPFDPHAITHKWAQKWRLEKLYHIDLDTAKKPYYTLMMFPYPSAEGLHIGSIYTFTGVDAFARFKRMQGYDVFEPFGLDAFGIHSENYALKIGKHPMDQAKVAEENFYRQMKATGNMIDWDKKLETTDPTYYKWTQWIFVQMFKHGLAERKKAKVNFCPSCKTVLADEQVIQESRIKNQESGIKKVPSPLRGSCLPADRKGQGEGENNVKGKVEIEERVGLCERCSTPVEKRDLEQWFFKITEYSERLLQNLDQIDWAEKIKVAQKNWIGKSEGAQIEFRIQNSECRIQVFTTRPDTLYGATFVVLAPEHELVNVILGRNKVATPESRPDAGQASMTVRSSDVEEIERYVNQARHKSEEERLNEGKEKTGVFSGLYAVHPLTGEQLPVWIADYVLASYGTGAIMAVPAHDERDFEFAKKFDLPIKQVIMPETGTKRADEVRRDGGCSIVFDPKTQKYAVGERENGFLGLFSGGVDEGEDIQQGILRELKEESGLYNYGHVEKIMTAFPHFANSLRGLNRCAQATALLVILNNTDRQPTKLEEHEKFKLVWRTADELAINWKQTNSEGDHDHWLEFLRQGVGRAIELGYDTTSDPKKYKTSSFEGEGIIINSEAWDGLRYPEDKEKILADLEKRNMGKREATYHLRDWLISRQRYWGPPIPMIFCENCFKRGDSWFTTEEARSHHREIPNSKFQIPNENLKFKIENSAQMPGWYPVKDEDLPVELRYIEDFKPLGSGVSPLARHPSFYETTCPGCGRPAKRETDVSDTFLDSSWYFLRYLATDWDDVPFPILNSKSQIRNPKLGEQVKNRSRFLPVTIYIGGAEHAVLHLLYARFVTMFLSDAGYLGFEEPFSKFYAHGLIIKDGAKMSKSKGNVILPDPLIKKFGIDTVRLYLRFLGPFDQGGDFRDTGIEGMHRFVKRVYTLFTKFEIRNSKFEITSERSRMMHKTIKGVTEDMEALRFNTAIAKIMTWYNFLSDQEGMSSEEAQVFLKLLAPFAPFLAEELWQGMKIEAGRMHKEDTFDSIHASVWPTFEEKYLVEDEVTIVVQVNGKVRGTMKVPASEATMQSNIEKLATENNKIKSYLEKATVRQVIFIPGKVINFVIE